jgi:hypothetical protein
VYFSFSVTSKRNITSPGLFSHNTFLAIYLIILGSAKIAGTIVLIFWDELFLERSIIIIDG